MESSSKRSRSSNWGASEKTLLRELIKEKIQLIENKDVSKNNQALKKEAWQNILQSFNENSYTKRDLSQLITQWRNTKNQIKKRDFEYRRACNATGGSPRPPSPPPQDVEIIQILPREFEVDVNEFDSDLIPNQTPQKIDNSQIDLKDDLSQPSCSYQIPMASGMAHKKKEKRKMINIKNIRNKENEDEFEQSNQEAENEPPVIVHENKEKMRLTKKKKNNENQELFGLAKSAREKLMHHQEAEHKLKMEIMEKEHQFRIEIMKKEMQYWEKKL